MDNFFQVYGTAAVIIWVLVTLLWLYSLIIKNTSIVDIFWGSGFVIITWVTFFLSPADFAARKILQASLVTIWGIRLTIHIFIRNWGKPEDFRYQKFRQDAGKKWWWYSYFQTFIFQGVLMLIIAAPLVVTQVSPLPASLTVPDYLAIPLWLVGFFFEAVGDWQLSRFKANPQNKGKLLDYGVWRYSRHPNYFGDAAQWWAFYLITVAVPQGIWTIFSPLMMTILLVRVSGVALLEKTLKDTKPGYKEYVERTSAFIPWFRK